MKVLPELMRHASARLTVDVYSQAKNPAKRAAQQRLVQTILPEDRSTLVIPSLHDESTEQMDGIPELTPSELQALWSAWDQQDSYTWEN
ncbi:MAG: hypothetical protein ND866_30445 [Pyrinomonadaceae bacterium]|nr:hypothetical protein [Pyrinomonadaceae bacterium]